MMIKYLIPAVAVGILAAVVFGCSTYPESDELKKLFDEGKVFVDCSAGTYAVTTPHLQYSGVISEKDRSWLCPLGARPAAPGSKVPLSYQSFEQQRQAFEALQATKPKASDPAQ